MGRKRWHTRFVQFFNDLDLPPFQNNVGVVSGVVTHKGRGNQ